ncbi:hypothetical protein J1G35_27195 [Pseudomonas sp. SH10-3B]|uniref:dermonecrotic toxin domain-containing protein n=1 Tax=Pseudomonas sp. SH10-3B TaxID=2816049 RepID=UPI001CA6F458|nr:DUF6543 domain-containing protein [Pseudomonas sp. SH10-3B]MBY8949553.1 hypothetical protein [Pseudomonas sp. SH10-3B]
MKIPPQILAVQPQEAGQENEVSEHPRAKRSLTQTVTQWPVNPSQPSPTNARFQRIQEHSKQLVAKSDTQMASQYCAALMALESQKSSVIKNPDQPPTVTDIPAFSTFGQAWALFTLALKQDPFARYARDNNIDISSLRWFPHADAMECSINGKTQLFSRNTPGWKEASAAVAAAAKEVAAGRVESFPYTGERSAPIDVVGNFYSEEPVNHQNGLLSSIRDLQKHGQFASLRPFNGPLTPQVTRVRAAQAEVENAIATATYSHTLGVADANRTPTPSERVEEADREVARQVSRWVTYKATYPGTSANGSTTGIPEDSSYAQAVQVYNEALSSDAFKRFMQAHNIDPSTVQIHVNGTLLGLGSDSDGSLKWLTFPAEHTQWAALRPDIVKAARAIAGRDPMSLPNYNYVEDRYPMTGILDFYGVREHYGSAQWLEQNTGLIRDGFPALLKNNPPNDIPSLAVRERQQAAKQRLAHIEGLPSPSVPTPTPPFRRTLIDKAINTPAASSAPSSGGPVNIIGQRLFGGEPNMQTVIAGLLKDAISKTSPSLNVDVQQLAFAVPDPANAGQFLEIPLMELAISHIAGADAPVFSSDGKFVDTRADTLARTGNPAGTALDINKLALQQAISQLPGQLNQALQTAKLDYWGKPPFNEPVPGFGADTSNSVTPIFAGDRRLMLSDLMRSNLRLASLKHPGLNELQREALDMAARYPHGSTRPKLADGSEVTVFAFSSTDSNRPDTQQYLTPNLVIERKSPGSTVVLVCEPSGKVTPYASLAAAKQAWDQNLKTQKPTATFSTDLTPLSADAFYIQASIVINTKAANAVTTEPTLLDSQTSSAPQNKMSDWMENTSDANRFILHELTMELAGYMHRNKEHTYNSDIPDIRTYIQEQLKTLSPPPVPYDSNDVEVTFHTPYGAQANGFGAIKTTKMSLTDAFIQNLAGLPGGSIEVRHKSTGELIPALNTEGALKALIQRLDVGKNYPELLKRELLDTPATKTERQRRFAQQVPIELKMKALELTAKGESGFDNAMGFRYLQAVVDPTPGSKSVGGKEITVRPLAFVREPGVTPDIVENMFLIEPKDSTQGPHILYRPLMADTPLLQFPSRQALLEAIQKPGKLQSDILAWLADEPTRTVYDHGGFSEPHLHANRVISDDFTALRTPDAPTLATTGAAIDDLQEKLQSGQLMNHLYEANAKAMTTLAERQTVSNSESRWATLKEGGFLLLNAALPALRGPAAVLGLALQTQGILGDIKTLADEKDGHKEAAVTDLLTNLAMLVLHLRTRSPGSASAAHSNSSNTAGMLLPGSVAQPPITNPAVELGGRMENVTAIDGGVQTFEDIYNGEKRINIIGHGYEPEPGEPTRLVGEGGRTLSASDTYYELLGRGIDIKDYKVGRTLMCHSAEGGQNSFTAQLHEITGIPFKGFEGKVVSGFSADAYPQHVFAELVAFYQEEMPFLSKEEVDILAGVNMQQKYIQDHISAIAYKPHGKSVRVNIGTREAPVISTIQANYKPSRFGPPKAKLSPSDPNFIPSRQSATIHNFDEYEDFKKLSPPDQKANSILLTPSENKQFEFFIDGAGTNPDNRLNIVGNDVSAETFEGSLDEATPQTAENLAALIAPARTKTNPTTLRLLVDKAAQTDFPQKLANATGLKVEAPMGNVPLFEVTDGRYWLLRDARSEVDPQVNEWITYTPE